MTDAPTPEPRSGSPLLGLKLGAFGVLAAVLVLDLWSKAVMHDWLRMYEADPTDRNVVEVIGGFLYWEGTWNPGVTFGLAPNHTFSILVLTTVAILAMLVWLVATRVPSRLLHLGLGLVLGGAIGNLYDRWHFHRVRDFVGVKIFGWSYPNFNVADSAIVVGVGMLIWYSLFGHGAKEARERAERKKAARAQRRAGAEPSRAE